MSVILTVAKNAGAAASGAILGVEGDSFQLSASSKAGWTAASARWEIYDFPIGFPQPAGWSTDGTTGAYFYATANNDPPAFTVSPPYWGKFMLSLTATDSGGITIDAGTAIDVRSGLLSLSNIGRSEGAVFGGTRKRWVGELQRTLKGAVDELEELRPLVNAHEGLSALVNDHETKLNTAYAQASTGNTPATLIDQLTIGSLRGLDAQTAEDQPDPLYIAGGRPHASLIGVDTNHNVIHHGGIGGTALNGEGGQLNFFGGDYRIPGCPPVLCGEIGYTWQTDYDLDPVSGLSRTPYALRLHSGVNPNTNARTRLVLQGYDSLSMESQFSNVITTVTAGNAILFSLPTTSSGNGLLEDNVSGFVQLSGATPGTIQFANRIPLAKLAHCDLTVISKSTDFDSREVFRLKFTWFGTVIALVENVADVGGYPSSAGRVAVTDNGTALMIVLTGLADGKTRNVTVRLRLEIQQ